MSILAALVLGLFALDGEASACAGAAGARVEAPAQPTLGAILDAIRCAETGGQPHGGRDATGDRGRAIGPFQIHRAYFLDSGVDGRYEDCREPEFARRVVLAYWKRWCPDALERCDAEVLARVHNGGPKGAERSGTLAYWRKIEQRLAARTWTSG
ncbi:MAG TPA: hypothetical protein VM509_03225 [Planctomycetota bacterium]|nr:hypothetical protein [Planctomycetota bacterium]